MNIVDRDIHRLLQDRIVIIQSINHELPFDPTTQVGAGSIDLRLSNSIRKYKKTVKAIDLSLANETEVFEVPADGEIIIQPGEIVLATTLEIVILPPNIAGLLAGRSSIARLGLSVHNTQMYLQPGHSQLVPLQLINTIDRPIKIKPFLPICQIVLIYTSSRAQFPYGSKKNAKYSNELIEPIPSKIGVELGLDKPEELVTNRNSLRYQKIQEEVSKLKEGSHEASKAEEFTKGLSRILSLIYLVLGACISLFIQELDVKPFPSLTLIISSVFILFCAVVIILANWRR